MSVAVHVVGAAAAGLLASLHAEGIGEAGPAWTEASFAALLALPGRVALVATLDDGPAGFILIGSVAGEAEIVTLAVLPGARRRGVGRALVNAASAAAAEAGAARLLLEVDEANAPARALYKACGFAVVGRRRGYYARSNERSDALILALTLASSR